MTMARIILDIFFLEWGEGFYENDINNKKMKNIEKKKYIQRNFEDKSSARH